MPFTKNNSFLRNCLFASPVPGNGALYPDVSWKNTTTGTYSGPGGNPTQGLSIGPFILGQRAVEIQRALLRRGLPAQDQSLNANTEWRTTGITKKAGDGSNVAAVTVYGETARHLMSMYSDLWLGDLPPEELWTDIERVQRAGGAQRRYTGLFNLESINQHAENNSLLEAFRQALRALPLRSNTNGTFSAQDELDQGEDNPYTGAIHPTNAPTLTTHTWMTKPDLASTLAALGAFKTVLDTRYPNIKINHFWDSALLVPNYGLSSNRPGDMGPGGGTGKLTTDNTGPFFTWHGGAGVVGSYIEMWRGFLPNLQTLNGGRGRVGINSGAIPGMFTAYPINLSQLRFLEFFFHFSSDSSGGLQANGNVFKTNADPEGTTGKFEMVSALRQLRKYPDLRLLGGVLMAGGGAQVDSWITGEGPGTVSGVNKGTWRDLHRVVIQGGLQDRFTVVTARNATGGSIFWRPEFGPIV